MRSVSFIGLAAAFGSHAFAACQSALKIDDFSKWSTKTNSLGQWTSDDSTMSSISASNGLLSFKPKSGSYFYETFPCQAATSNGLTAVQFTLKGPSQGSVVVELQTKSSCSAGSYSSYYAQVTSLTGSAQTVTLPFTGFSGANGNAITGLVWSGFSSTTTTWQLSNIELVCSSTSSGASSVAPSSTKAASSVVVSPSASKATSSSVSSSKAASTSASTSKASSSSASASKASSSSASASKASSSSVSTSKAASSSASTSKAASSSASASKTASSSASKSSSVSASKAASTLVTVSSASPSGTCSPLLIDDWISQSRLTFLFYNSFNYPTSMDDSLQSLTVGKPSSNRVTIVPKTEPGYFYSQFPCVNAKDKYGGISLRIKAPAGTTFSIELSSSEDCDPNIEKTVSATQSTTELGWTFDGTEKLYLIPFSKYPTLNTAKLTTILYSGFSTTLSFGPMAFYCGASGEYIVPPVDGGSGSSTTVAAPSNTAAAALVIDKFASPDQNAMGFWHGGDEGMTLTYNGGKLTISAPDADYSFYTQVSAGCSDFSKYKGSYLHIAYTGSTKFTVALQQHNEKCNAEVAPFPETWDSAEASRYAKDGNIYIPLSHFNINFARVIGFSLKGFYSTDTVTLSSIEIVPSVPAGFGIPPKDETGQLVFACKRPNSFAFAIDDGVPDLAQDVLKIIREEDIKVTFFTVGAPLLDQSTNLTNVYREMIAAGHQLALHSHTHPKMEGLPDYAAIDWEYNEDIKVMKSQFNGLETPYFRPPFGNEGARMRSRLAKAVGSKATITNWSVDVEDWLWATSPTPEQQLLAFQRDVNKGGNLVVLHYLYPSTVSYLRQFIQIAKATGKQLMRVDQCMEDPSAPPL